MCTPRNHCRRAPAGPGGGELQREVGRTSRFCVACLQYAMAFTGSLHGAKGRKGKVGREGELRLQDFVLPRAHTVPVCVCVCVCACVCVCVCVCVCGPCVRLPVTACSWGWKTTRERWAQRFPGLCIWVSTRTLAQPHLNPKKARHRRGILQLHYVCVCVCVSTRAHSLSLTRETIFFSHAWMLRALCVCVCVCVCV